MSSWRTFISASSSSIICSVFCAMTRKRSHAVFNPTIHFSRSTNSMSLLTPVSRCMEWL
jgi:hypothetical protein